MASTTATTTGNRDFIRRMLTVNAVIATVVITGWLVFGGDRAIAAIQEHWPISLTMVFGSLVGGGTSEGGGAVAFPVLTKVLDIPAPHARMFTYAVQSIGMVSASITILANRVPVERRVLAIGAVPAALGGVFGVLVLAPLMSAPAVRMGFTLVLAGLALAMIVQGRLPSWLRHDRVPFVGAPEVALIVGAGLVGGMLSGIAGVGENTVMFILLVLLFRVSEKIATPTTVVLLSIVSVVCFATHVLVLQDFTAPVVDYWLAAAPIVCIGAPLGALLCTQMSVRTIRIILFVLIGAEYVSTVLLVPMTPAMRVAFAGLTVLAALLCYFLVRVNRYAVPPVVDGAGPAEPAPIATATVATGAGDGDGSPRDGRAP